MKSKNKDINKFTYYYTLKDRTTMRKEEIAKKIKNFKKLYTDTIKHEHDIRKWIDSGKRKKGDIRRSLEGLDTKYQELSNITSDFKRKGIFKIQDFNIISEEDQINVIQLEEKIGELYNLAGIERKQTYNNDVHRDDINLVAETPKKLKISQRIKNKIKNSINKEKSYNFRKFGKRVASFAMAIVMVSFAGGRTTNKHNKDYINTNENSKYTDTNREDGIKNAEDYSRRVFINELREAAKTVNNETLTQEPGTLTQKIKKDNAQKETSQINIDENKEKSILELDDESEYYIAPSGTTYTASSDGSGSVGYFSEDTLVKKYRSALVKTNKYGEKEIIHAPQPGESWSNYAKERKLDLDEMIEPGSELYTAINEVDGVDCGWVKFNELRNIEKTEEIERTGEVER